MAKTIAKWFKCLGCKSLKSIDFGKKESEKLFVCECGKHSKIIK